MDQVRRYKHISKATVFEIGTIFLADLFKRNSNVTGLLGKSQPANRYRLSLLITTD